MEGKNKWSTHVMLEVGALNKQIYSWGTKENVVVLESKISVHVVVSFEQILLSNVRDTKIHT